jgi:hypothetical protein
MYAKCEIKNIYKEKEQTFFLRKHPRRNGGRQVPDLHLISSGSLPSAFGAVVRLKNNLFSSCLGINIAYIAYHVSWGTRS